MDSFGLTVMWLYLYCLLNLFGFQRVAYTGDSAPELKSQKRNVRGGFVELIMANPRFYKIILMEE